jgi:hypothetical protein
MKMQGSPDAMAASARRAAAFRALRNAGASEVLASTMAVLMIEIELEAAALRADLQRQHFHLTLLGIVVVTGITATLLAVALSLLV